MPSTSTAALVEQPAQGPNCPRSPDGSRQHAVSRFATSIAALDEAQDDEPGQGGRARPRRLPRRRPDRHRRPRRRDPRSPLGGQAGGRLCGRLYRRQLPARRRRPRRCGSTRWARSRSPGRAASNLYFKGLLDKLGVTANVYRVGTYKSAVEPFIRNDMSPEARENYHGARPGDARNLAPKRPPGAAQGQYRPVPQGHARGVDAAGGDMAKAALERQAGRPHRRPPRLRSSGSPQLGGTDNAKDDQGGYKRIKLAVLRRRRSRPEARGPDRRRHHRRDDRRREGAAGNRRRRYHRRWRSKTGSAPRI